MTVSLTGPVSIRAIRDSFEKSDRVASDDRYVRDFNQFSSEEIWDLEAYRGQAYGLQTKVFNDGWGGGDYAGDLPLDQTDKRVDGRHYDLDQVPNGTYAYFGEDGEGKYAELGLRQYWDQDSPGAVAMNGVFYANEEGQYRVRATVETLDGFPRDGSANILSLIHI